MGKKITWLKLLLDCGSDDVYFTVPNYMQSQFTLVQFIHKTIYEITYCSKEAFTSNFNYL